MSSARMMNAVISNWRKTSGNGNGGCWPAGSVSARISSATVTIRSRAMASVASSQGPNKKVLTIDNVNPNLKRMEYAVRGPLLIRALEIEKEIEKVRLLNHLSYSHTCIGISSYALFKQSLYQTP